MIDIGVRIALDVAWERLKSDQKFKEKIKKIEKIEKIENKLQKLKTNYQIKIKSKNMIMRYKNMRNTFMSWMRW
jgi:hypothetical protein